MAPLISHCVVMRENRGGGNTSGGDPLASTAPIGGYYTDASAFHPVDTGHSVSPPPSRIMGPDLSSFAAGSFYASGGTGLATPPRRNGVAQSVRVSGWVGLKRRRGGRGAIHAVVARSTSCDEGKVGLKAICSLVWSAGACGLRVWPSLRFDELDCQPLPSAPSSHLSDLRHLPTPLSRSPLAVSLIYTGVARR